VTVRRNACSIRRALRRLRRDESGASLVEMGFLLPILAVMIAGIIDLSMGISERFSLQQSLNRSLEIVQANRPSITNMQNNTVNFDYLRQEVATVAGVTLDKVTLNQWLECNGVRQGSYNGVCLANQDIARYVELTVTKNYVGKLYVKTVPLRASAAVRVQ
jgi:Flp pilus assembly protein TadG